MRQRDLQLVEPVVLRVAPQPGRGQLQDARLHRDADGRQRDAVLVAEVGDGLDGRVDAGQVVREVAERGDAAHVLLAQRAIPQGQQRADAGTADVDRTGEQGFIDGRAARELHELDLDRLPLRGAVLLDQLQVLRDMQQQVDDAELLGNAQLAFGGTSRGRCEGAGQAGQRQRGGRDAAAEGKEHRVKEQGSGRQGNTQAGTSPSTVVR